MGKIVKSTKEMVYDDENYVVTANSIIRGKQSMSLQTARLIRLLITQIAREDKELGMYKCRITDLAKYLGIPSQNLYRDIDAITDEAMQSVVYIGTGDLHDAWKKIHWISTAEYDGNGTIILQLSQEVKSFVVELDKYFTQYKYKNILFLKSFYAIRLYELIVCEDGEKNSSKNRNNRLEQRSVTFSVSELREWLGCEDKLSSFGNLKKKAIEPQIAEINKKTDIYIEPVYHKTGRSVTSVEFIIKPNANVINGADMINDYANVLQIEAHNRACDEEDKIIIQKMTDDEIQQRIEDMLNPK